MVASFSLYTKFMVVLALACSAQTLSIPLPQRDPSPSIYTTAHSLGDSYHFHHQDGWMTYNASNLSTRSGSDEEIDSGLVKRSKEADKKLKGHKKLHGSKKLKAKPGKYDFSKAFSASSVIGGAIKKIVNTVQVIITWYTGEDLLNPSCWPQPVWTPTDQSFVSAITEIGWEGRPKCFDFLELCNGPQKCIFCRVVDTCAGCAPGSKHVDLTKSAFSALADINVGLLTVQLRLASEPEVWNEELWGPQAR
ncbi:Non-catalytic module family EXPN protein [Desarmillaria tabescens]|uniref:Non-catalytic module family EXPN protein n=1 Tax=Armillaria tabescens TaxID=1929756 RepID=A0AA39NMP1_ARMTA|nr:Non-catalytic module family EXPN protein [Desarmillaria tabescens]KAK0468319.1 Non-catalytic module family EXPN protein [Desarmillaria tabescens]